MEDVRVVLVQCRPLIERTVWEEDLPEFGKAHLRGMIDQMEQWTQWDNKTREKLMRWLGWLQAAIVIGGGASLEDMRRMNRGAG